MSKNQLRKHINKYHKRMNRTHYLKWDLDNVGDWSIRYFFNFDTKPKLNNKWVLKSHIDKEYIIISASEALDYIMYKASSKDPKEYFSVNEHGKYRRAVINHGMSISEFFLE